MDLLSFLDTVPSLIYTIQILIAACLVVSTIPKRRHWLLVFILSSALFLAAGYFTPDILVCGFLYLPLLLLFILLGPALYFVLNIKLNGVIFCVLSIALMQHTAECCTMSVRFIIGLNESQWAWMLVSYVCYAVIYALFYAFLVRKIKEIDMKPWKVAVVSVIAFLGVFTLRNIAVYWSDRLEIGGVIRAIYNIYGTVCCVFCMTVMFSSNREDKLTLEAQMMNEFLSREQEHYNKLVQNQDVINRKCHDLKYQIEAARKFSSSEEQGKVIEKLERDVMIYDNIAKTGNVALDYTISEKVLFCTQNDIQFTYIVEGDEIGFMEPTDIYTLFGNALDNAIECVLQYEDREKRIVSLYVAKKGNILRVHFENYCEESYQIINGEIQTHKQDKENHGFGLRSIRYIAEKYGGYAAVDQQGDLFMLDLMFPLD